jgi:hypothetical protein
MDRLPMPAEVDEAAGLVGHEGAEVRPHDALPSGPVRPIKLLRKMRQNGESDTEEVSVDLAEVQQTALIKPL